MRSPNLLFLLLIGACTRASSVQAGSDAASPAVPPGPDAAAPVRPVEVQGFAQRFVDYVKQKDANAPVKPASDLELQIANKAPVKLDGLFKECQAAPADCDNAMDRFVQALGQVVEPPKVELQALTVALLPEKSARDRKLFFRPFVGPLVQALVLTSPDTIEPLGEKDLKTLKVTEAAAWTRALANLSAAVKEPIEGKPFVDDAPGVIVGQFTNALGGGRVILHERWEAIAKAGGGDLHVAIPSRETIIWTSRPSPREANALRWLAQNMTEHENHPLAPTILRWTEKGWELEDKNEERIVPADQ
jgi:hypothetical protein